MHRTDNARSSLSLPTPEAPGPNPDGYFQDKSLGVKGTAPTHDWLNALQEEICYVITQQSISLSKTVRTQLYDAIAAMIVAGPSTSGISAVVDDTSPKLGNDLTLNGFKIVSESNGDIEFDIAGDLIVGGGTTMYVHTYLRHLGDLNNYIEFGNDTVSFYTNGSLRLDVTTGGMRINGGGARITRTSNDGTLAADSAAFIPNSSAFVTYATNKAAPLALGKILYSYVGVAGFAATSLNIWTSPYDPTVVTPPGNRYFCPVSGTIRNMYARIWCNNYGGASTNTTCTITLYKNGSATSFTHTIPSGQTNGTIYTFSILSGVTTLSISAGDDIYFRLSMTNPGGVNNTYVGNVSFEFLE